MKSSSGESIPAGAVVASSHPYKIPPPPPSSMAKYDSDFPLRKTGKAAWLSRIPKARQCCQLYWGFAVCHYCVIFHVVGVMLELI